MKKKQQRSLLQVSLEGGNSKSMISIPPLRTYVATGLIRKIKCTHCFLHNAKLSQPLIDEVVLGKPNHHQLIDATENHKRDKLTKQLRLRV